MSLRSSIGSEAASLFAQAGGEEQAGQLADAAQTLVACLRLAPWFGPGFINLANILCRLGMPDLALAQAQNGLALLPGQAPALLCLAAIQHQRGAFAQAIALYEQVLARDPGHAGAMSSLGSSLQADGRLDAALAWHARAVAAAPGDAAAHYNYADALLAAGDFARGWAEYEWRLHRAPPSDDAGCPRWTGERLDGGSILLTAEQGFGDTLQFARYVPLVAASGARVVLSVPAPLVRLLRSLDGGAEIVASTASAPRCSVQSPLLSLPLIFGTRVHTIPAAVPYLHAEPALAEAWRARTACGDALRVGLVWAGSAHRTARGAALADRRRSLPLAGFAQLAGLPDVAFFSLQTGEPASQVSQPPPGLAVCDVMQGVTDFADTAAFLASLDLVISVDTAVAHLAGALGRPVWLLSRADGCWRWLTGRDDTPWYPTMRLYRQAVPMQWEPVMARIRQDLAACLAARSRRRCAA